MGRKKIDTSKEIFDKRKRSQTILKRKRGFLKKTMELAKMCGLNISLVIDDPLKPNQEITCFQSSPDFDMD